MIISIVEDREKKYKLGVNSFLTKPIDPEKLNKTVSSLIARSRQKGPAARKKILIIEGDGGAVGAIESLLKTKDYDIVSADYRYEIQKAQEERPNLVIIDYIIYKVNCCEIVRVLRSIDETRDCQIIILIEPLRPEVTAFPQEAETDHNIPHFGGGFNGTENSHRR